MQILIPKQMEQFISSRNVWKDLFVQGNSKCSEVTPSAGCLFIYNTKLSEWRIY